MKWLLKEPSEGDMIRVKSGTIYHYGIYVSDDEVVQFGLAPAQRATLKDSDIEVLTSDIDAFLNGGFLEVCEFDRKERKKNRKPDEIVQYTRSKLGTRGYNILYNNCEHFANECVSGIRACSQADEVRAMFRSLPVVDVYFARVPNEGEMTPLYPPEREREVQSVSNERVKREKYYVWRLLEYALEHSFGFRLSELEFTKKADGRWSTPKCEFSLSHSGSAVAVAVSRAPVGVDIELPRVLRVDRMAEHILDASELGDYEMLSEEKKADCLIRRWTAKEATFKSRHLSVFEPTKIQVSKDQIKTDEVVLDGERYVYSVATATPEKIRIYSDVRLSCLTDDRS